jgi:hypothetical protein
LGAPPRLLKHLQLVGEAAEELMQAYESLGIGFDRTTIELGVAVHDAGKILHPSELTGPGSDHEQAGEALMLANDVQPDIARCCVSHAAWRSPGTSFEELSVALADKLWKGKREAELELRVIDAIAHRCSVERWDIFAELDGAFEEIASSGAARLERSQTP